MREVFAHAPALDTPAEQSERQVVTNALYELSGQTAPYPGATYTPTNGAAPVTTTALKTAEDASSAAARSAGWAVRGRIAGTALPKLLGTAGMAIGAFQIGWTIGTGVRQQFFTTQTHAATALSNEMPGVRYEPWCVATSNNFVTVGGQSNYEGCVGWTGKTTAYSSATAYGLPTGFHWFAGYDTCCPAFRFSGFPTGDLPNDPAKATNPIPGNYVGQVGGIPYGVRCNATTGSNGYYCIASWVEAGPTGVTVTAPHPYDAGADGAVDAQHQLPALPTPADPTDPKIADAVTDPANAPIVDVWNGVFNPPAPATYAIPDCRELTVADCETQIHDANLAHTHTEANPSDDPAIGTGRVVATSPASGTQVTAETDVAILTDPGPATADVPSCGGKTYEECSAALETAGFTQHHKVTLDLDTADLDTPADQVVSLEPDAGTTVEKTTDIAVKTNPPAADMPVVVPAFAAAPGETFASYAQRLQTLGLAPVKVDVPAVGDGNVAATDAAPGTRVRKGDSVTVKVATQPDPLDDGNGPSTDKTDDRCELGDNGNNTDPTPAAGEPGGPGGEVNNALYAPVEHFERATGEQNPDRTAEMVPVDLLTGYTRDVRPNPKKWTGWGYRKIFAKHGWSDLDIAATREALTHNPTVDPQNPDRLTYTGEEYDSPSTPGLSCVRIVGVLTAKFSWEPVAKQILTSFGKPVKFPAP